MQSQDKNNYKTKRKQKGIGILMVMLQARYLQDDSETRGKRPKTPKLDQGLGSTLKKWHENLQAKLNIYTICP